MFCYTDKSLVLSLHPPSLFHFGRPGCIVVPPSGRTFDTHSWVGGMLIMQLSLFALLLLLLLLCPTAAAEPSNRIALCCFDVTMTGWRLHWTLFLVCADVTAAAAAVVVTSLCSCCTVVIIDIMMVVCRLLTPPTHSRGLQIQIPISNSDATTKE